MAALSAQQIVGGGLAATYGAVGGSGDTVANDGKRFVHIKNGNAGTVTVTIPTPGTYKGKAIADDTITLTTGTEKFIGPWDPEIYNDSSGNVSITCSPTSSVTIACLTT